jgi:hypothetical protein
MAQLWWCQIQDISCGQLLHILLELPIMLIFFKLLEVTYNIRVEKIQLDNSGEMIQWAL